VEQHGGLLRFEPHQPQGTIFTFTLPLPLSQAVHRCVAAEGGLVGHPA